MRRMYPDGLHGEGFVSILAEHGDQDVIADLGFCLVGCGDINEDVSSLQGNFRMVGIDDWRHGADCGICVEDHRIDGRVSNNMEVARQVLVLLIETHDFVAVHRFCLVQGRKVDLLWSKRLIGKGSLDRIEIMSANGDQRPLSCKVLVQFILQIDKGIVSRLCEFDIP